MGPKSRRLSFILVVLVPLGISVALVLAALKDNIVYFYSPTEILVKEPPMGQRLRVGGLVKQGSYLLEDDGLTSIFVITDKKNEVTATHKGVLPDLFREGQGVVGEGHFNTNGIFEADKVLAKHDENYMPPEVAEALRKNGVWKGSEKP